jgi:hypothetical protein
MWYLPGGGLTGGYIWIKTNISQITWISLTHNRLKSQIFENFLINGTRTPV